MNETLSPPVPELPAEVNGTIQEFFAEIDEALAQMRRDQIEIETLRKDTQTLQAETEALLTSLKGMF